MAKCVKKNKYEQKAEAVLDLHGLTAIEAEAALDDFLASAKEECLKRVRVITGRGVNSPHGQAILKPLIEDRLSHKGYSFRQAKVSEGGEGALEVTLG